MIDLVSILYNRALAEYRNHTRTPGTVWVSALTQCPLKWHHSLRYPELALANFFNGSFEIGKLVHVGIQAILQDTFTTAKTEVELEKKINGITVRGRADAIVNQTVIEIKYARSDQSLPHIHHVDQLRIYMNLAKAEKGVLFYITPERVAQFEYSEPMPDSIIADLIRKFKDGKPAPRFAWECRFCPFRKVCPNAR